MQILPHQDTITHTSQWLKEKNDNTKCAREYTLERDRYGGNELKCKDKIIFSFGSQKEDSFTT